MIITLLLVLVVAAVVAFVIAASVRARRDFHEQNQVVPGITSKAPASWAGAHSPEARLHRRLRDAVIAAHTAADTLDVPIGTAITRLDSEAVIIDDRLVAAAALPKPHREPAIERIESAVTTLEVTVATIVERASEPHGSPELVEKTLDDTDIALEALARARAEVEALDRLPHDPPADH